METRKKTANGTQIAPRPAREPGAGDTGRPSSAALPDEMAPAVLGLPAEEDAPNPRRRTWPQRVGALLLSAACIACAVWYVPRVVRADRELLSGTVASSGIVDLNFAESGQIGRIVVHIGQRVRKGQVLATEYTPNMAAVVSADKAAIAFDHTRLAQLHAAAAAAASAVDDAQQSAVNAQLAFDEAELATNRMKMAAREIVAPASGTIVAANGRPGEVVTATGIRNYVADSPAPPAAHRPAFSLVPEGPQSVQRPTSSQSALPVIALRTSAKWQVVALVPEGSLHAVNPGQAVTVSVPAAGVTGVRGRIGQVLPTPVSTSDGAVYQAGVTILGQVQKLPLDGMAADIRLDP